MAVNKLNPVTTILRVLLAAVFLVSSVAKLMSIDDFELYIFSYGFFSLNLTYIVARICIAAEFLTGLFLALGWWRRWVWLLTIAMLIFFSLFLCYAALAGRTDSCQCFGRMADLNPMQSLLKNAVLLLLTLFYGHLERKKVAKPTGTKPIKIWLSVAFILAALGMVFCLSVPDNWIFKPNETRYNQEAYSQAIAPDGILAADSLASGSHLVAFVTPGCPYCRMSREKLTSIAQRNHLDTTHFHYYEPADLPDSLFLEITYGQRPLILLVVDGKTVATFHYRNINERLISRTLPQH